MDVDLTNDEIVLLVRLIQAERDDLRDLLVRVTDSVQDKAPDGMSIAYLDRALLTRIRGAVE